MNTTKFKYQLAAYSASAAGFLASHGANAQVAYTDIDPDLNYPIEMDYLWADNFIDFNSDGIADVNIWLYTFGIYDTWFFSGTEYWGVSTTLMANAYIKNYSNYLLHSPADPNDIQPLNAGALINDIGNWNNVTSYTDHRLFHASFWNQSTTTSHASGGEEEGNWLTQSNKYIGVKFLIGANYHFGWIRLSTSVNLNGTGYIMIQDYAYEETPGAGIIAGEIPNCVPPLPIGAGAITGTTAKLKWETAAADIEHYELQYRITGELTWTTKIVSGLKIFRKVAGLTCDNNYEWRIRTICTDGEFSAYSPVQNFSTLSCRTEDESIIDEENIQIYSNAKHLYVNIDEEIRESGSLMIFDNLGRKVFEQKITEYENVLNPNVPAGIYIIKLEIGQQYFSEKVVL